MGILDRLFKGKKQRGFLATQISRLTSDWITTYSDINSDLRNGNLERLWARAKDLLQNNPWFRRYLQLVVQNVVGSTGFSLKIRVYPKSDETEESANEFKKYVLDAWNEYVESADVTGLSWFDFHVLILKTAVIYGEVFIRTLPNLKLQIVPPYLVDPNKNEIVQIGRKKYKVINGVVLGDNGEEIAYYLKNGLTISSKEMIHWIFSHDFVEQTRGYPTAVAVMRQLHHLSAYEESEAIAARIAAAKMAVLTQTGPLDIMGTEGGSVTLEVEPGQILTLPAGYDIKTLDWQYPKTSYSDFVKAVLRSISSGLGISYVSLANDLESVNYSSARVGLLEEREFYASIQRRFIEGVLKKIFWNWFDYQYANGRFDRRNIEPVFVGRRWAFVDPLKDVQAQVDSLKHGLISLTDLLASQGLDFDEQIEEIAKEKEKLRQKGLILPLF